MAASCLASSEDVTIVDRLWSLYEATVITLICTINEAVVANCAAADAMSKFLGITEREQVGGVDGVCYSNLGGIPDEHG